MDEHDHTRHAPRDPTTKWHSGRSVPLNREAEEKALKNIRMRNLSWGITHNEALLSIQDRLRYSVKLDFRKPSHPICLFTDASEDFWARIVTQTEERQLEQKMNKQQQKPMAFLGGRFAGAQKNWTAYEKEAYTIVQTFEWMNGLLWEARPVHVFTDHWSLLYVFSPLAHRPNWPRHVLSKVHRWAIHFCVSNSCLTI